MNSLKMFKKDIDLAQIPDYTGSSCVRKPTQKEKQHESTQKNPCSWCGFPALLRFCLYQTVPAQHDCNPDCFRSLHPCGLPKQLPKCSRLDLDKPHRTGAVHRPNALGWITSWIRTMFIRANGSICTSGQHRASRPSADAAVTGGSGCRMMLT